MGSDELVTQAEAPSQSESSEPLKTHPGSEHTTRAHPCTPSTARHSVCCTIVGRYQGDGPARLKTPRIRRCAPKTPPRPFTNKLGASQSRLHQPPLLQRCPPAPPRRPGQDPQGKPRALRRTLLLPRGPHLPASSHGAGLLLLHSRGRPCNSPDVPASVRAPVGGRAHRHATFRVPAFRVLLFDRMVCGPNTSSQARACVSQKAEGAIRMNQQSQSQWSVEHLEFTLPLHRASAPLRGVYSSPWQK